MPDTKSLAERILIVGANAGRCQARALPQKKGTRTGPPPCARKRPASHDAEGGSAWATTSPDHPAERHEVVLARSPFAALEPWSYEYERDRTIDDTVGYLYSTSYASRRLLGSQVERFESELRRRLLMVQPSGQFRFDVIVSALLAIKP